MNRITGFEKTGHDRAYHGPFDLDEMVSMIKSCGPLRVNIGGADSKNNHLPEPSKEKLLSLNELQFTIIDQKI